MLFQLHFITMIEEKEIFKSENIIKKKQYLTP